MNDDELNALFDSLPKHTQIILSENIQPRCGCSKPGVWQLQRDLSKQGKSLEVVAIATCPRCEATWLWGEP